MMLVEHSDILSLIRHRCTNHRYQPWNVDYAAEDPRKAKGEVQFSKEEIVQEMLLSLSEVFLPTITQCAVSCPTWQSNLNNNNKKQQNFKQQLSVVSTRNVALTLTHTCRRAMEVVYLMRCN